MKTEKEILRDAIRTAIELNKQVIVLKRICAATSLVAVSLASAIVYILRK